MYGNTERDGQETIDYEAGSQVSLPTFGIVTIADEGFSEAVLAMVRYVFYLATPKGVRDLDWEDSKKDKLNCLPGWFAPWVSHSDRLIHS